MTPQLHVYSQAYQHDECIIVGNREGLRALLESLRFALDGEGAVPQLVFTSDGEGYDVLAVRLDSPELFDRLSMPYKDDVAPSGTLSLGALVREALGRAKK